jgi:hypothetical protein
MRPVPNLGGRFVTNAEIWVPSGPIDHAVFVNGPQRQESHCIARPAPVFGAFDVPKIAFVDDHVRTPVSLLGPKLPWVSVPRILCVLAAHGLAARYKGTTLGRRLPMVQSGGTVNGETN